MIGEAATHSPRARAAVLRRKRGVKRDRGEEDEGREQNMGGVFR
jgi:hypothetical protein